MNKHNRRKLIKSALERGRSPGWQVMAVHDAGHAVARYLAAHEMGYVPREAIAFIDVVHEQALHRGLAATCTTATTYGPMLSRPMDEHLRVNAVLPFLDPANPMRLASEVASCRRAGIDVRRWAETKAYIALAGPVAEAIFTGRPVSDVIDSPEC